MRSRNLAVAVTILAGGLCAASVHGVDGVIEINQAKALAGGVTPGDTEGFPVTITVGGSYRLTSNLDVADKDASGIITSSLPTGAQVDIDLNGFTLSGPVTCTFFNGLTCTANQDGTGSGISGAGLVGVHDGTVQGFGTECVMPSLDEVGPIIRNLKVRWCDYGVRVVGGALENVTASMNVIRGIDANSSSLRNITATLNGGDGIFLSSSSLDGCSSVANAGDGIEDTLESKIFHCALRTNFLLGLHCSSNDPCGYAGLSINDNNGGTVSNGIQLGLNICEEDTTCP